MGLGVEKRVRRKNPGQVRRDRRLRAAFLERRHQAVTAATPATPAAVGRQGKKDPLPRVEAATQILMSMSSLT